MRTHLRLGAAAAVGLGALLLATVLASPALAWHSNVTVTARCFEGQVRVHYKVQAWQQGHEATVAVAYDLNGTVTTLEADRFYFAEGHDQFTGHVDLPADTTGTITFVAVADWKDAEPSSDKGSAELPPAGKCEESTTSSTEAPTTTATPTTEAPTTTVAVSPSSSLAPTTTAAAVGAVTSTTSGGALPFTGNNSGPMLLAGIVLVGGGALFLLLGRAGDRHAAR